jgi:hypothetical protein
VIYSGVSESWLITYQAKKRANQQPYNQSFQDIFRQFKKASVAIYGGALLSVIKI